MWAVPKDDVFSAITQKFVLIKRMQLRHLHWDQFETGDVFIFEKIAPA